jgi:hypothetical protein
LGSLVGRSVTTAHSNTLDKLADLKEHIQAIKINKPNSKFAQHIPDTIDKPMEILHIKRKGPLINKLECFYIYNLSSVLFTHA